MAGEAILGDLSFRIAPSQVHFEYSVHTHVINTVGGRVVQVFGASLGDMTIHGLFGEDRVAGKTSPVLAEEFASEIGRMVQQQSVRPSPEQLLGTDPTPMHPTFRFRYNDDTAERRAQGLPIHNWDFQVYIKSLRDAFEPEFTVSHKTGKFSHGYTLTLFIVDDNTGQLQEAAQDGFIEKLTNEIGWKRSAYNGFLEKADLQAYLGQYGQGNIHQLVLDAYKKASGGEIGVAGSPVMQRTIGSGGNQGAPQGQVQAGGPADPNAPTQQQPAADPNAPAGSRPSPSSGGASSTGGLGQVGGPLGRPSGGSGSSGGSGGSRSSSVSSIGGAIKNTIRSIFD